MKPNTKSSRIETLKEMMRAFGLNPEEILTKEALSMPNRTVIASAKETSNAQMDALLNALKQRLREDLLEKPLQHVKRYELHSGNGSMGEIRTLVKHT